MTSSAQKIQARRDENPGEYAPSDEDIEKFYALGRIEYSPGSDITPASARDELRTWLARVRRDAAREALDGLLAHAEERCGLSKSHRARDDWNTVAGATQDYRDTHYPEETP